jgi:hypothetical protein
MAVIKIPLAGSEIAPRTGEIHRATLSYSQIDGILTLMIEVLAS